MFVYKMIGFCCFFYIHFSVVVSGYEIATVLASKYWLTVEEFLVEFDANSD